MAERAVSFCGAEQKGIVRLLQFLLKGPATSAIDESDAASVVLVSEVSGKRSFQSALISHCQREGLISQECGVYKASPLAHGLLRRLLSGTDLAFASQHGELVESVVVEGGQRAKVVVNQSSSPLGLLSRMKARDGVAFFPEEAIAAGERLSADFHFAGLQPRITASWEPRLGRSVGGGRGGQADISDHTADARARVARAADAIGPELSGVVLDVCCFEKGLERVEQERQWPARSAKLMLRTALMALSRHYKSGSGRKSAS